MFIAVMGAALTAIMLSGCTSTETPGASLDSSVVEELSARAYFGYKSNVEGKVINEWQSPDGLWQRGQFIPKRTLDQSMRIKEQRGIDAQISGHFKVRRSDLEAVGALLNPHIEAAVQSVGADRRVTVDKGSADGVKAGYYATAMVKLSDVQRQALQNVMWRYYYENISEVVGMFEVVEAGEHSATLRILMFREGKSLRDIEVGVPVIFGFAPKWKYEILDTIPYAVGELPRLEEGLTGEMVIKRLTDFLVEFYDGDKVTIDEMIKLLEDNSPVTRRVVGEALARITGKQFGYDPALEPKGNQRAIAEWKAWWGKERSSFNGLKPKKEDGTLP
jgi:hypothetical protein